MVEKKKKKRKKKKGGRPERLKELREREIVEKERENQRLKGN